MKRPTERIVACERWNARYVPVSRFELCRLTTGDACRVLTKACREPAALVTDLVLPECGTVSLLRKIVLCFPIVLLSSISVAMWLSCDHPVKSSVA